MHLFSANKLAIRILFYLFNNCCREVYYRVILLIVLLWQDPSSPTSQVRETCIVWTRLMGRIFFWSADINWWVVQPVFTIERKAINYFSYSLSNYRSYKQMEVQSKIIKTQGVPPRVSRELLCVFLDAAVSLEMFLFY